MIARSTLRHNILRIVARPYSAEAQQSVGPTSSAPTPPSTTKDVPGLSKACVAPASGPVGPNVDPTKTGPYKAPEYYLYNRATFYEAEIEMSKLRCPQPSANRK